MPIKQSILAILAISVLTFTSSFASAEVKIAVVDVQNAILQSEEAKRLLTQIQEEFKGEEDEIRKIQSEAAALLERMNKDADVMSDAEKRRLQQQIESMNNDFVYLRQKLQRQIEERQKELFTGIDSKIQKAIEELVLSEDYDMILPRAAALYVTDLYNITRKVTEKLNQLDAE
ncbi:MAG: OmpH family outer membrane protein [Pseudomonadales bacterium]|nr:OmpH family outer membrane protein [Pseudomonadales bacterium]MDG1442140.1 OmpH family outer membrane protein [Pseudomonadales bacterium]